MTFEQFNDGKGLKITLDTKLTAVTAETLENDLKTKLKGVEELVIDMSKLAYVSSAGLRLLLKTQKTMELQGKMTINNADPNVMSIFKTTGFDGVLNIQN